VDTPEDADAIEITLECDPAGTRASGGGNGSNGTGGNGSNGADDTDTGDDDTGRD
jgi:hypothetical protein